MTVIVGLKCIDGVVLSSDSQQEFGRGVGVKRLNMGKIYKLDERFAIAGAGTLAHIEKAIDSIKVALLETKRRKGGIDLCEDDCVNAIEIAMLQTHKRYNIDRAAMLEDPTQKKFFQPILICGAIEKNNGKDNACLFIIHADGVVEKISNYATAGSGAAYAELLLKNYYFQKITIEEAIPLVIHTISEVIDIDPNVGGAIRVTVVKPVKVHPLSQNDIDKIAKKTEPLLDLVDKKIIPKILKGEISVSDLKKITGKEEK